MKFDREENENWKLAKFEKRIKLMEMQRECYVVMFKNKG